VVDDGSSDRTEEMCRAITDPRFRYVYEGRLGRPRALNVGIDRAQGDFIAINDADDLSLPHRLEYSMTFLRAHPEVAFLGTGFAETAVFHESVPREILTATGRSAELGAPLWPSRLTIYRKNLFNNSTLLFPKAVWRAVGGYDERLSLCEDYDFYLRALQCGKAALLPGQTVLWYTNPNGFFKQKSLEEYLTAMGFIKRRALGLLGLPRWMRFYHPVWVKAYQAVRWYSQMRALIEPRSAARSK